MSVCLIELLYRNLQEVFGEGDAARRRVQDFYTEDCVLYAPPGVFVGHNALDKFAGDLRATHPRFVYTSQVPSEHSPPTHQYQDRSKSKRTKTVANS
jgi:hypothetical protein